MLIQLSFPYGLSIRGNQEWESGIAILLDVDVSQQRFCARGTTEIASIEGPKSNLGGKKPD
jgi:hypothetical protein